MEKVDEANSRNNDFYVDFVYNDGYPYLLFNGHGIIKKCEITGRHQLIVCRTLFKKPGGLFRMLDILGKIRENHEMDGTELKNDNIRVVITAIENINEKVMPEFGLDDKLIFHNQNLVAGVNPKYIKK